jgi:hypothetical protein
MAEVFISFVHEDQRVASAVQDFLRKQLWRVDSKLNVFMSGNPWQVYAGEQ